MTAPRIHPLAEVRTKSIGEGTTVWQFAIVLEGASVGRDCNINCHTFIEGGVTVGDRVTLKAGVYLWAGVTVEDDVFIGPNATFANDNHPRSKRHVAPLTTLLQRGCSIGAHASLSPGLTIGRYAMVGLGSVVLKDVPAYALVYGNPARQHAWVDETGAQLLETAPGFFQGPSGARYELRVDGLAPLDSANPG